MKIKYKSTSFEFEYDDEHERDRGNSWSVAAAMELHDKANKKGDILLKLAKEDAEAITRSQVIANESKQKGIVHATH